MRIINFFSDGNDSSGLINILKSFSVKFNGTSFLFLKGFNLGLVRNPKKAANRPAERAKETESSGIERLCLMSL